MASVKLGVWDVDTLTWVRGRQPVISTDNLNVSLAGVSTAANQTTGNTSLSSITTNTNLRLLAAASGSVSGVGNNTLITPTSGKKLRVAYLSYNPALAVECAFRFGAAGTLFLRNSLLANSVVAKDFGDMRYVEGAIDESLILNLSLGVATIWNCFYQEI